MIKSECTITEAAEFLNVSSNEIEQLLNDGSLYFKVKNGVYYIPVNQLYDMKQG